jgi:HPt (histidine-containing phosphotransfer) domain-containing protein
MHVPILNKERFIFITGDSPEQNDKFATLLKNEVAQTLPKIIAAVNDNQLSEFREFTHRLEGCCATYGAIQMQHALRDLKDAQKNKPAQNINEIQIENTQLQLQQLKNAQAALNTALQTYLFS